MPTSIISPRAEVSTFLSASLLDPPLAKLGDSLEEFLVKAAPDTRLRQLMMSMAECSRTIAFNVSDQALPHDSSDHVFAIQVRTASCDAQGCMNSFGDEQLAVDLRADQLLFEALTYSVPLLALKRPTRM